MPSIMRRFLAALLVATAFCAGCGDDPAGPGNDTSPWTTVDLGTLPGDIGLLAVAAQGPHAAAVGQLQGIPGGKVEGSSILLELQADGTWSSTYPAPGPGSSTWLDLALDTAGKPILAGYGTTGCVLDMRSGSEVAHCFSSLGCLTIDGDGSLFVAGGASTGGELWTSRGIDQWVVDALPLSGTNDSGFTDVDVRGDKSVACGYDDGSDNLAVILQREGQGSWTHVAFPEGVFFGRTLQAVALTADGAILVGGIQGAGGLQPQAFLSVRSPAGDWTDIALPKSDVLGGVNDILLAADGTTYLACSGESESATAQIVHATTTDIFTEISPFTGQLRKLAQTDDGTVYAVGYRLGQRGDFSPVMLRRLP